MRRTVQLYMAGHGGDGFMKFQDQEELTSSQLADALATMHAQAGCLLHAGCSAFPPLTRKLVSFVIILKAMAASCMFVGRRALKE